MTARLPFTQAAIERAIRAAEKRGYKVGGVKPNFGKGRPDRKLTVEQVREIIALKGQKSHVELAAIYNVSDSMIRKIQQGINWRDGKPGKKGFKPGDPRNVGWKKMLAARRRQLAAVS